jgi:hypothetical protein
MFGCIGSAVNQKLGIEAKGWNHMKLSSSLVCVMISLSFLCHSTKAQSLAQPDTVVTHAIAEQWREDLRYLAQEMPARHKNLFHTIAPEQFTNAVKILDGRIPSMTRAQIIVEFERIVAMVQDGHTRIQGFPFDPRMGFHSYPLALYLYKDGLFVRAADRTYIDAVGARVVKIGNAYAEQAMNTVRDLVCRDNEMGIKAYAPLLLVTPEVLHAVGLVDDIENAKFVIERDGRQKTIILKPTSGQELVSYVFLRKKPENWFDARDNASVTLPLWLKDPGNNFWFEYLTDSRILYVQYNAVEDKEHETVAVFAKRLFEFVDAHPVDRFVIDLRLNGGGNNQLNRPLLLGIIKANKIDQPGRLFAIIGRNTFSAAQSFVDELEKYTNTIFVGEPTAENVNQYGDPVGIVLPNSGITVRVSTLWWQYMDPRDIRQWTPPLVSTPLTAEDYRDNIDPAMKAIVSYVPKPTLTGQMREALLANDLGLAIMVYKTFKNDPEHEYAETEAEINSLGYELMARKRFDQAIETLKLNVGSYPNSWNAYDSLGEAYLMAGDKRNSIANYEKSLNLNPKNSNAAEHLRALRGQ